MGCYCSEIRKYEADIATLNKIKDQLEDSGSINKTTITRHLEHAAVTSEQSVSPDNLEQLKEKERTLNDELKVHVDTQIDSCTQRIRRMRITLSEYKVIDKAYHARKRKKK
ncbi:hypothetical protein [Aminipila sp.]|uniref:hypothetical protein n=1 Tax=Aminipila sp. TaxID=2060095 RepID=UPI002896E30A|nr:hypothetical protein [Aminipila sp.]